MEHTPIRELVVYCGMHGTYLLQSVQNKVASTGNAYIAGTLRDNSGTIPFIMFDYRGSLTAVDIGKAVSVIGEVDVYNNRTQIKLSTIELADSATVDWNCLVPTAPIDLDKAMQYIFEFCVSDCEDGDYNLICTEIFYYFEDALRTCPAAMSVHHAFVGGLLMHTASMMQLANKICDQYESMGFSIINRDLLVAGAMLHDVGKIYEFDRSDHGLVKDYSVKGQLMGHAVIGAQIVEDIGRQNNVADEKIDNLKHLILSHHGKVELGAAIAPKCIEAELLSMIDNMDSRVEIYRENLKDVHPGTFGEYNKFLSKRVYKSA